MDQTSTVAARAHVAVVTQTTTTTSSWWRWRALANEIARDQAIRITPTHINDGVPRSWSQWNHLVDQFVFSECESKWTKIQDQPLYWGMPSQRTDWGSSRDKLQTMRYLLPKGKSFNCASGFNSNLISLAHAQSEMRIANSCVAFRWLPFWGISTPSVWQTQSFKSMKPILR